MTITAGTKTMNLETLMRRAPVCGIAAHTVRRQILMKGHRDSNVLAPNKQIFQNFAPQPPMGSDRHLNTKELYAQIRRTEESPFRPRDRFIPPRKPRLMHGSSDLSAIEEMSPIRSETFSPHAPMTPAMRRKSDWNPQLTSTTTSFQPLSPLNLDSDDHFKSTDSPVFSSTPRSERLYRKHQKYGRHTPAMPRLESTAEGSSSQYPDGICSPQSWTDHNNENQSPCEKKVKPVHGKNIRPEAFGLHNAYAKHHDIRGIVFLGMSLCGRRLTLNVQNAAYFRSAAQPLSVCSYLSVTLFHRSRVAPRDSRKPREKDETVRTRIVTNSNCPSFDESFQFTFAENCYSDTLVVTVYEMDSGNVEKKKVLGCMTFPVSRLLKKASKVGGDLHYQQKQSEDVEIFNEGFFLLNKDQGRKKNFPQRKVCAQTFYEDPVFTGMSSASSVASVSHGTASSSHGQMTAASPRLSVPNELTMGDYYHSSTDLRVRSAANLLDYTFASSSTNGSSGLPEKLKFHRATLPSITTTTSENNSDDAKSLSPERPDHNFLCPDDNGGVYGAGPAHSAIKKSSVRRAASFTFSPKHTSSKNNLRPLNGRDEDREKRRFLGPLSRTLSYLRTKMDIALSTSALYPTRDEVRQWETSFDSLLNNKYGNDLFRQFLKKEFSEENMEFWHHCEDFKKMKDGKKATTQKAMDIFNEFVAEHSPKEVNLDSDTRCATKAAVEGGCKPDTFTLAQHRVEQLMMKDSYRRFLRDRLFLDLLESFDNNVDSKEPSSSKDKN